MYRKRTSRFLRIDLKDIAKSLLIAIISSFLIAIYPVFQNGSFPDIEQLKLAVICAISNAISYLIKNVFTNSNNEFLKPEER